MLQLKLAGDRYGILNQLVEQRPDQGKMLLQEPNAVTLGVSKYIRAECEGLRGFELL